MTARLITVVRADLPIGAHTPQAMHAMRTFVRAHPTIEAEHDKTSGVFAVLSIANQGELLLLMNRASDYNIAYSEFVEPDLDNAVTAATFEPSAAARWLTRHLQTLRLAAVAQSPDSLPRHI